MGSLIMTTNEPKRNFVICGADPKYGAGCGKPITWDNNYRRPNGKMITLEEVTDSIGQKRLQEHRCPVKEEARKNQISNLVSKVDSLEGKITGLEYKVDQVINRMDELMKFFSPNAPQPTSELT